MDDSLLCRLISNPARFNRSSNKVMNLDSEIYNILKRRYPDNMIDFSDFNLLLEVLDKKIEEIHIKNLSKTLVDNVINGTLNGYL